MAILQHLEELRIGLPAVETVAYMDLRSGTVLGKSSAVDEPQERLDALCALVGEILGGASGETDEAVLMRSTEALVLRRAPGAPAEALCLVCAPDVDISQVMEGARRALGETG